MPRGRRGIPSMREQMFDLKHRLRMRTSPTANVRVGGVAPRASVNVNVTQTVVRQTIRGGNGNIQVGGSVVIDHVRRHEALMRELGMEPRRRVPTVIPQAVILAVVLTALLLYAYVMAGLVLFLCALGPWLAALALLGYWTVRHVQQTRALRGSMGSDPGEKNLHRE